MPSEAFRWSSATRVQRRTLIAAALGWMLDAFDVMLYSIVLAHLMAAFGMSRTTAGLLNTLTLIASAIGSFVLGMLADRFGRRRMLSFSVLTYSVFTFACGLSNSIGMLATFRFLLGFGMGGEWNCGATLVAETWPATWRGRALGIVQSSWAVGYAAAAVAAGLVLAHASWRFVFFLGIVPAALVLWIRRAVPEPDIWQRGRASPSADQAAFWRAARGPLLILLATNTCGMFAWWGLFTWIPTYVLSMGSGLTSFLIVLNLCGMLPGYLLFGAAADKFGRKPTLIAYLALAALSVPAFAAAQRPAALLLTGAIAAFFGTGFFTGSAIIGAELFPTPIRAAALGASYNMARGLSAFAPLAIGKLSDTHGLKWSFGFCALAFALAAISACGLPESSDSVYS